MMALQTVVIRVGGLALGKFAFADHNDIQLAPGFWLKLREFFAANL